METHGNTEHCSIKLAASWDTRDTVAWKGRISFRRAPTGPQSYLACVPPPPTTGPAVEGQLSSTRGDSIDGPGARSLRGSGRSGILQHHPAPCCMLLQSYFPWLPSPSPISHYQPHLFVPTPARRPSLPWAKSLLFATSARRPLAPHRAHGDGLPTDECAHPIGWVIEISNLA